MIEEQIKEKIASGNKKTEDKKLPKRDDELWKGILEDVFEDFLRFFFPKADEIFNMKRKFSFMDKEFNRLFPPEEGEFNTYKLLEQDEMELRANPNPFAVVALVVLMALKNKNANDENLRLIKLDLTKELIKRKVSKSKHIKIMDFLAYYVNFQKPEMMIKFEEEVEQLTGRTRPMGVKEILIERAKNKGKEEERAIAEVKFAKAELERTKAEEKTVGNLIIKLGLSDEQVADIATVSLDFVRKVRSGLNLG